MQTEDKLFAAGLRLPPPSPWQRQAWGGSASLPLQVEPSPPLPTVTERKAGWWPQRHQQVAAGTCLTALDRLRSGFHPQLPLSRWAWNSALNPPKPTLLGWGLKPLHKPCRLPSPKVTSAPQASGCWLGTSHELIPLVLLCI